MTVERFDASDAAALALAQQGVIQRLNKLDGNIPSDVKPENGVFGFTEVIKDNGKLERTWTSESGTKIREYLQDGKITKTREAFPDHLVVETRYDDNGTAYYTSKATAGNKVVTDRVNALLPNTEIVKGNIVTRTDSLGRTIRAAITDLTDGHSRDDLNTIKRDASYLSNDQKGDIIAKRFGGRSSPENIVPQLDKVNLSSYKKMENYVADLKAKNPNAKVDLEIELNYKGTDKRPSSFQPKIMVDDVPYELPKEYQKIYNTESPSVLTRFTTTAGEKFGLAHDAGIKSGLAAVTLSAAVSTIDNVGKVINGEITAQEAFVDVAKDTGAAGALGYGTTFVSTAVAEAMKKSSHTLIQSLGTLGKGCVPAAVISFGVQSFDSAVDFAKGEIDGKQLAYVLGKGAANVAGGTMGAALTGGSFAGSLAGSALASKAFDNAVDTISDFVDFAKGEIDGKELAHELGKSVVGTASGVVGGALAGAALGSVVPGAGTVAGFAVGAVGGMVSYALASEAYATAVEVAPEIAEALKEKAQIAADGVADLVKNTIPDKLSDVKSAINGFAAENKLPIHI